MNKKKCTFPFLIVKDEYGYYSIPGFANIFENAEEKERKQKIIDLKDKLQKTLGKKDPEKKKTKV